MDLEIKKDMINSHFNNLIALYDKLNAYKEKILGEGSSVEIDSLESVQKKEQLLILAGSINEIQTDKGHWIRRYWYWIKKS